jgi:hypothetical protein
MHATPPPFETPYVRHATTIPSPPSSADLLVDVEILPHRLTPLDELALGLRSVDLSSPEASGIVEMLVGAR